MPIASSATEISAVAVVHRLDVSIWINVKIYLKYIRFLIGSADTHMRQRSTIIWLAVVVAASAALILLLNIAPEAPKGVAQPPAVRISEVPTINAIPIVKLSELDYLLQTAPGYAPAVALYSASERPAAAGAFPAQSTTQAAAANLQVAGVDEEDYVKFDGENLYVAVDGRVYVVGPDLAVKASAPCPAHSCVVFVWGDRLLTYGMRDFGLITAYLYRLPALAKVAEFNFSGVLPVAARMAEGFVYIVTTAPPSDVVINGVKVAEAPLLSLDVPPIAMVIAAVDMNNDRFNASVLVSGSASRVYMKDGRLYVAAPLGTPQLLYKAVVKAWDALPPDVKARLNASDPLALYKSLSSLLGERDGAGKLLKALNGTNVTTATSIYVFDLNGLDIRLRAAAEVPGSLLNQFAIEELDGRLVVATTVSDVKFLEPGSLAARLPPPSPMEGDIAISEDGKPVVTIRPPPPPAPPPAVYILTVGEPRNSVYLLDPDGRTVSALEGLAPGERIYAARLVERTLYLVAYRQVDPLFAIDLSDVTQPKVLGFLKIPGLLEYLHPVDGGRLLGVGTYEQGIKIALFDVSKPTQLREISNITATNVLSPVLYDHHAFAYSPKLRLALIPVASWRPAGYVLAVEVGDRLSLRAVINATAHRAFFGRDAIYLVGGAQIWKYAADLRQVATTELR